MPHRLYLWIDGWATLLDGIIILLSFTLIHPSFGYKLAIWQAYKTGHKKAIKLIEES